MIFLTQIFYKKLEKNYLCEFNSVDRNIHVKLEWNKV